MGGAFASVPVLARACVLALFCCACDGGHAGVGDASDALQRHRTTFAALDRWVRRTMQGAELLGTERALAETLFAKVRADRSVLAAWVEQSGKPQIAVALPADAMSPVMTEALRLRDDELGTLEVLVGGSCPARRDLHGLAGKAPVPATGRCAIVARTAPGPRGPLRVTAAFED